MRTCEGSEMDVTLTRTRAVCVTRGEDLGEGERPHFGLVSIPVSALASWRPI